MKMCGIQPRGRDQLERVNSYRERDSTYRAVRITTKGEKQLNNTQTFPNILLNAFQFFWNYSFQFRQLPENPKQKRLEEVSG